MFKVHVNDGQNEMPTDDIFYIVAKEGVFLKKKLGIMESLAPVQNISVLESVSTMAKLHIRRIPGRKFANVINFFKAVYAEHRSESVVLLFYNEEKKRYKIFPPHQKVTGASLDYNRGITIDGLTMIGTIHSHASMSAFHSGVDDDDEKAFDGLHITIGDVDEDEVSISASIIANGYRFMVDPSEYVTNLSLVKEVDETKTGFGTKIYKMVNGKLVLDKEASKKTSYTYRKYDKRYVVNIPDEQQTFNKKWMDVVEKGTYAYKYNPSVYGLYGGNAGWGRHYDPTAWRQFGKVGQHLPKHLQQPPTQKSFIIKKDDKDSKVEAKKTEFPITEIDVDDEDFNPCENCLYRDYKIAWAIEQYTEEIELEDDEEEDLISNFVPFEEYTDLFENDGVEAMPFPEELNNEPYLCPFCNNKFFLNGQHACPYCYSEILLTLPDKTTNKVKDTGTFLKENDEFHKETIRQAQKIPDPEKAEIPLNSQDGKLKNMFKKVFSKERS